MHVWENGESITVDKLNDLQRKADWINGELDLTKMTWQEVADLHRELPSIYAYQIITHHKAASTEK